MINWLATVWNNLLIFGRAGGGGSSSGDGGADFIYMIPGVIVFFVVSKTKKRLEKNQDRNKARNTAIIVGVIATILITIVVLLIGDFIDGIFALVACIFGIGGGLSGVIDGFKRNQKEVESKLSQAATTDSRVWNEAAIINYATHVFNNFQID